MEENLVQQLFGGKRTKHGRQQMENYFLAV